MCFTRASFHFPERPGHSPARTLYLPQDGYPDGAADCLRTMLQRQAASSATALVLANDRVAEAGSLATEQGTAYRYHIDAFTIRAEKRRVAGQDTWQTLFVGSLVDFINQTLLGSYLHVLSLDPAGPVGYYTLMDLEKLVATAQRAALRAQVGLGEPRSGEGSAAGRLAQCQALVREALVAEIRIGRYLPKEEPEPLEAAADPEAELVVPLQLTAEQLAKLYPTIRCFERYDANHRADRQASRRMGHRQREATGEYFYQHPLVSRVAYPTAQAARTGGWRRYQELEKIALEKLLQKS